MLQRVPQCTQFRLKSRPTLALVEVRAPSLLTWFERQTLCISLQTVHRHQHRWCGYQTQCTRLQDVTTRTTQIQARLEEDGGEGEGRRGGWRVEDERDRIGREIFMSPLMHIPPEVYIWHMQTDTKVWRSDIVGTTIYDKKYLCVCCSS